VAVASTLIEVGLAETSAATTSLLSAPRGASVGGNPLLRGSALVASLSSRCKAQPARTKTSTTVTSVYKNLGDLSIVISFDEKVYKSSN
jgi:hypothetical protein